MVYFSKETGQWFDVTLFGHGCLSNDYVRRHKPGKGLEVKNERLKNEYEMIFNSAQDAMFLIEVINEDTFYIRNSIKVMRKVQVYQLRWSLTKPPWIF